MSRAPASFAQFFPSAPRAAKDKAKERERSKSHIPDSSTGLHAADNPLGPSQTRAYDASSTRPAIESNITATDSAPRPTEDNASPPGDTLNGVGSASSYTSTISSSVSSVLPIQATSMSALGPAPNTSSLTPLTAIDSSPNPTASPIQDKQTLKSDVVANPPSSQDGALHAQVVMEGHESADTRTHARDPKRSVKGAICTYDPNLDRKLSSNDKKKAKPTYKEFGLVRIHNLLGSVILLLRMSG